MEGYAAGKTEGSPVERSIHDLNYHGVIAQI
jgi:hypothetical protein